MTAAAFAAAVRQTSRRQLHIHRIPLWPTSQYKLRLEPNIFAKTDFSPTDDEGVIDPNDPVIITIVVSS